MCGICGSTRATSRDSIAPMNAALRHRGPDDEGIHYAPAARVAIGARRLSVIDPAGGHQPLSNESGEVWAVLNGELYNHPRLRDSLQRMGHRFATATDTEVLVHLYEEYREDLVHALDGMYAFAIWDATAERLLLARDRFGEKPLFYLREGGELLFASELDALRAGTAGCDELSPEALDAFFVHGYVPGPDSILRGPRQLPPAHLLTWSRADGARVERYWRPPNAAHGIAASSPELLAETEQHLRDAVASRLVADVPVGVFLSGGLDSTLIAALATEIAHKPLKTFTVGYDVGDVDELRGARATAQRLDAEHHELVLTSVDVAERVPAVLASLDQPLADQALAPLHAVAALAREHVTVALGGEGADELFAGYPRYRWLSRAQTTAAAVPAPLAALGARVLTAAPLGRRGTRVADVLAPNAPLERQLEWVTDRRRRWRSTLYGPRLAELVAPDRVSAALAARLHSCTSPAARAFTSASSASAPLTEPATPLADELGPAELMRLDQLQWLPDDVLCKADRAGMLVSLEVRAPYLSRDLAEFAASVAPATHMRGAGKLLLRGVLERVLPGPRPRKTAFRAPAGEWLRGPLAPVLHAQARNGTLYSEGWFARAPVRELVREHTAGHRDHTAVLWPLLALGLWLDRRRGVAEV